MRTASLLLMSLGLMASATAAHACSCRKVQSACLVAQSPGAVVFVGRVTGRPEEPLAKASVEERVANVPPGLTSIEVESGPCGSPLLPGEPYVFIGRRRPDNGQLHFPAGTCGDAFPVEGNERVLDALRQQAWGGDGRLMGSVRRSDQWLTLLPAVTVTAVNRRGVEVYQTRSGDDGRYEFVGLAPGRYELTVSRERFVPDSEFNSRWSGRLVPSPDDERGAPDPEDPGLVDIASKSACEERDLAMLPNGEVAGTVRGEDGQPVAGVPVELFETSENGEVSSRLRKALSDELGAFRFEGVPAGSYIAGVNLGRQENAYPPVSSSLVKLEEHEAKSGVDLTVRKPRREFKVRVAAIDSQGNPVKEGLLRMGREDRERSEWSVPLQDGAAQVSLFEGGSYLFEVLPFEGSLRTYVGSTPPADLVIVVSTGPQ